MNKNHCKVLLGFFLVCVFLINLPTVTHANQGEKVESATVVNVPERALKMGMRGVEVTNLQKRLTEVGYFRSSIDGIFGSDTFNAVYSFQYSNNLTADGVVGKATVAKLNLPKSQIQPPRAPEVSRGGSKNGVALVNMAKSFLGTRYVWGGRSPGGFDCSGFICYMLSRFNVNLPRMADAQFNVGVKIPKNKLVAGDLVFFTTYTKGPSHVGIYMGDGNFIHASSAAGKVTITPMSKPYYVSRYLGARRLVN